MGLDIYAGTLTRYYSNWKTVVQQWAEKNGYSISRISPDGEPAGNEEELSPAEGVQATVENWRDQILDAISQPDQPPYAPIARGMRNLLHRRSPIGMPWALCLVAACHTYGQPVPPTVEKDWDFGGHP